MWTKQIRQWIWQWRGICITAPSVAIVLIAVRFTGGLQLLEWAALDQFFLLRPAEPADARIVIVNINEEDIAKQGWPISDGMLAKLLERVKQYQPRAIGVDLYRDRPISTGHSELTKLFESTPNLIGIAKVVTNPAGSAVLGPPTLQQRGQVGASDLVLDSDGKIRRSLLSLKDSQGQTVSSLAAKLALMYLAAEGITPRTIDASKSQLGLGNAIFVPLKPNDGSYVGVDAGGYQILADFRNPSQPFLTLSMTEVLEGQVPPDALRDKIVLVGTAAESLGDYFYTSYSTSLISRSAGVNVHAAIISQIISAAIDGRSLIQVWAEPWEWLWILLWAGLGARLGWTLRSQRWTAIWVAIASSGLVGCAYVLFLGGWWVPLVPPLLALVGAAVVNKGYILWDNLNASYRALEDYSRTLEQKVEARTLELSQKNTQLQQEVQERERAEAAIRKSEQQLRNQNAVLLRLSRNKALYRGDLSLALQEITEAGACTLETDRASVWLYDETRSKIQCFDLYVCSAERHSQEAELAATDYPVYFAALNQDWIIVVEDVQTDVRIQELHQSYLVPHNVTALLGTPIQLGGQIIGILFLEQVEQPRSWTVEEQNFAASLADLTSLAIEAHSRQRAEKALREAEEKYRSIFENAVEGIFQSTPKGYYLSANPALARIYGYDSPLEMFGRLQNIAQQLYVDPTRQAEFVRQMQQQGEVIGFESQVYRKDGSIIWISENARAVYDDQGTLLYYEGIVEDITERKQAEAALRAEQEKSERLLLNILPKAIAEQLKQGQGAIATRFEAVTVLFSDIVDFTGMAGRLAPTELVTLLNEVFSTFDQLAEDYGLEKIKTIGDAYMVVGGLPEPRSNHAEAIAEMALKMQEAVSHLHTHQGELFRLRIGINTGPVVAGVIGIKKFSYDLWGDTVNVASRMETHGEIGRIHVTEAVYQCLKDIYDFAPRGTIPVKGKGTMNTYFLKQRKTFFTL